MRHDHYLHHQQGNAPGSPPIRRGLPVIILATTVIAGLTMIFLLI